MRTRFDQLVKQLGLEALGPLGLTLVHHEIAPEVQYADIYHEPDPAHTADRDRLGLLGRIASGPCLIEAYSQAVTDAEFRACLGKHIAFWQRRARKARMPEEQEPVLWIITARAPKSLVARLGLVAAHGWPLGVYLFGDDVLRVGLIAADELLCDTSTLLVRLMAGGPLLPQVLAELIVLPEDAYERIVAGPVLLRLHHALVKKPSRTSEEEEIIVATEDFFEFAREQGQKQGRAEARANDVLTVLRVRGISVPDTERERILAEADPARLERWLERAIVEPSLAGVLDEPS